MNSEAAAELDLGEIRELDRAHVWHPFLNHGTLEENPLGVILKAEGCSVWDGEGREYLDAMAALWCVNIGYGRKEVAEAAYRQLLELPYFPLSQINVPAARLAAKLAEILPAPLERIWFSNSGSEAVDTAIKIARAWGKLKGGRYKIIARYQGYHGGTMGGASLTGQTRRRAPFEPLLPGVIHVQAPYFYRSGLASEFEMAERCEAELDAVIRYQDPDTVAAFIAEPVIGGGGVIPPPADYLKRMREVCDRHGVLMIADEVITGFGRTGELFASDLYGIRPDIMTMAKGLSSAYLPIGATAASQEIFEVINAEGEPGFQQINTYGGHPVSCAAALKNIEILLEEELAGNAREVGKGLGEALEKLRDIPCVGDVRGVGLLWGVELIEENGDPLSTEATARIVSYVKEEGVLIGKNAGVADGSSNTITLAPPLILTEEQAGKIASAVEAGLRKHLAEGPEE
jgi:adenosylmethionine-8-amino-7-oxononanoate aminotransferase